jgi:radical SAM/Cys-rich protein
MDVSTQLDVLNNGIFSDGKLPLFKEKLKEVNIPDIKKGQLKILQLNIGYMCNQTCSHCHVDAGPNRKEMMSMKVLKRCLSLMIENKIETVDITGGAPEMHPNFRWFVKNIREKTRVDEIIVRSNLTIILANKKFFDLPIFFADNRIHIISSLPFYNKEKTDNQRGKGVFDKSILALKELNKVGYGKTNSNLKLDLVYNPSGAFLPPDQESLEIKFKEKLYNNFKIEFNNLFTITNLPISRFLDYLIASENYEEYMETLVSRFNPNATKELMCKNTISVSWEGYIYDCDFNQMLDLKINSKNNTVFKCKIQGLVDKKIQVSQHCYGCTAGAGSSCQGTIA